MKHRGLCPICFSVLGFASDVLPSSVRCDCGTKLIALRACSLAEVPVHCLACQESYLVEPEDIGERVECECGAQIEVHGTVMRAPIKTLEHSDSVIKLDIENDRSTGKPTHAFLESENSYEESSDKVASPGRRKNWLHIAGIGGVIGFLLVSVGAFALSRRAEVEPPHQSRNKLMAAASKPVQPFAEQQIDRQLLAQLLSEVPDPHAKINSGTVSIRIAASFATTANETEPRKASIKRKERSRFGGPVAKRNMQPPAATETRQRIPEVPVDRPRMLLSSAYNDTFDSYEVLGAFEDQEKNSLSDDYRKTLGETIFLCRHAFQIAQKEGDRTKVNELTYLLAYLSYTAGQTIEASIYGEMAARWGDAKEAATREAAMIAITACQEANASHWGNRDQLGELDQMRTLTRIVQQRWPGAPQLDAVWMHLAQSYFAFGQPRTAAETFLEIKKKSNQFGSAQLAAGNAYWSTFIDQASTETPDPNEMVSLLKSAEKHLREAVDSMQGKKASPTLKLVSAKILLSKIAERLGDQDDALQWLEAGPMAVTQTITTRSTNNKNGMVMVDKNTADSVFNSLYRIKISQGNWNEAYQSLAKLDAKLHPELGSRFTALAKGFIENLKQADKVTQKNVSFFEKLIDSVESHDVKRYESMQVWLGQSWASFGMKADSDELSKTCLKNAEHSLARALQQPNFPQASQLSVAILRADLLQQSGNNSASLEMLGEVLQMSPNAVAVQLRAAKLLQKISFQQDQVSGLLDAINGPSKGSAEDEFSPIWGWVKLANTLYQLSYSDKGTEQYKQMSREAGFHLARCQWLLAEVTEDPSRRENQLNKLKSQLTRRIALSGSGQGHADVWLVGLETLLAKTETPRVQVSKRLSKPPQQAILTKQPPNEELTPSKQLTPKVRARRAKRKAAAEKRKKDLEVKQKSGS